MTSQTQRVTLPRRRPWDGRLTPPGSEGAASSRVVPTVVRVLTAVHVALLLAYTLLFPAHLAPDEPQHVDMVIALLSGDGWPGPGERILSEGVYRSSDALYDNNGVEGSPFSPGDLDALKQPYRADDFGVRGERPSLEELGGNAPSEYFPPNQIVQHPPLWHATGALVLAVLPGSERWPYDVTVAVLRLVSVLMLAPLPLLAWAVARRLSDDPVLAQSAAALAIAVPGLTKVGASAGNDAALVLMFSAVLLAVTRIATGDTSRRTAVATGVLVSLALLSKGFALTLPALVVGAYGFAWHRQRSRSVVVSAVIALAVSAVGMLWWVANLVRFGVLQPRGYGAEATAALRGTPLPPGSEPPLGPYVSEFLATTTSRFWSGLGVPGPPIFDVRVSTALTLLLFAVLAVALVAGVRDGRASERGLRPVLVLLLLPVVLLLLPLVWQDLRSYRTYDSAINEIGLHGRYLLGGVVGAAVVAAVGCRRLLPQGRWCLAAVTVAVLAVQLHGVRLIVERLWSPNGTGLGGLSEGYAVLSAVSPWPPVVTALPFLALAVLVPVLLVLTLRPADSAHAEDAAGRRLDARL